MGNSNRSSFEGKVVWVIGASSGIGEALAESFFENKAKIIISARNFDKLNALKERLEAAGNANEVSVLPLDVTNLDEAEGNVGAAFDLNKRIDAVVLACGVSCRNSVLDTDFSVQEESMKVNFLGPAAIAKYSLPHLIDSRGQISVLSSIQGKIGLPNRSAYAASKHALHGFFDSLRAEVSHLGVGVTLLVLGYVRTNLSLNALTTDADTKHGEMDPSTSKGFLPKYAAARIVSAMKNRKEEVVISQWSGILAVWLKRLTPSLLSWVMKRRGRKLSKKK